MISVVINGSVTTYKKGYSSDNRIETVRLLLGPSFEVGLSPTDKTAYIMKLDPLISFSDSEYFSFIILVSQQSVNGNSCCWLVGLGAYTFFDYLTVFSH